MATGAPPSAPMLSAPAPEPDDIPDPAVPAAVLETPPPTVPAIPDTLAPLAHGFVQYVQGLLLRQIEDAGIRMTKDVDRTITEMANFTKGVLASNEHASYQLSDALLKLQDGGLTISAAPYEIALQVRTPAGIPLTLTIRKRTAPELLDELTRVEAWLAQQGYAGAEVAV